MGRLSFVVILQRQASALEEPARERAPATKRRILSVTTENSPGMPTILRFVRDGALQLAEA
jgi:hypothetical protein